MHINNEIGNMLDLKTVGELCHKHGALFHSDTVQSVGHYEMNLADLPVDLLLSAHISFMVPRVLDSYMQKAEIF